MTTRWKEEGIPKYLHDQTPLNLSYVVTLCFGGTYPKIIDHTRNAPRREDFADSLWMMYEHGGDFLDAGYIANNKMFHFAEALLRHLAKD